MRICSFLPSATEILYELNAGNDIVGVTHECNYPPDAKNKPIVVRGAIDTSKMSSKDIDLLITEMVRESKDIYVIDDQALKEADPDIIIAQGLCKVCSPYFNEVERAMHILDNKPEVVMLDPHNLTDILDNIMQIGKAIDREEEARILIDRLKARIDYIKQFEFNKPRVLAIEWLDPLYTAGHWVPDMINMLAVNLISKDSEPSRRMSWEEVLDADADIIVLMACGFNTDRIIDELHVIENEYWNRLKAVKSKQVYAVDATSYFNRPGPRIVTGIEILAKIIHPSIFRDLKVPNNSFKKVY